MRGSKRGEEAREERFMFTAGTVNGNDDVMLLL